MTLSGLFFQCQHMNRKNISRSQIKNEGCFSGWSPIPPHHTFCPVRFCQSCLQECLRPQKPVCAVCRAGLGHWTKAVELEALIQSSVASCKGCGAQVCLMTVQKLNEPCWFCVNWIGSLPWPTTGNEDFITAFAQA